MRLRPVRIGTLRQPALARQIRDRLGHHLARYAEPAGHVRGVIDAAIKLAEELQRRQGQRAMAPRPQPVHQPGQQCRPPPAEQQGQAQAAAFRHGEIGLPIC